MKKNIFILFFTAMLSACSPSDGTIGISTPESVNKYPQGVARKWDTPHSGQIRAGNGYQFEGVPIQGTPGSFTIYVYDEKGRKINLNGSKGARMALYSGGSPAGCDMVQNSENSYSCQIILQDALNLKVIAYVGIPTGQIAKIEYDFLAEARPDLSLPSQTAEMPITK